MKNSNHVQVVIDGKIEDIHSPNSPEYMQNVAMYLNKKIEELKKTKDIGRLKFDKRALLIQLNLADDIYKEKEKNRKKTSEIEDLNEIVEDLREENAKLHQENDIMRDKVQSLEKENYQIKKELKEYFQST